MASGVSKRFGTNKLLQKLCNQQLFTYILDSTKKIFPNRVVVTRHEEIAAYCENHSIPVILHTLPDLNDTIRLGLSFFKNTPRGCIFCPSDQPLLSEDTLAAMAEDFSLNPQSIVRLCHNNQKGAPVVFPRELFDELLTLPPRKGGGFVMQKNPDRIRYVSAGNEYELFDVDTPDDLEYLASKCSALDSNYTGLS